MYFNSLRNLKFLVPIFLYIYVWFSYLADGRRWWVKMYVVIAS